MIEAKFFVVPVPIRDGVEVRLHFPEDITRAEAEKVARVIRAYAADAIERGEHIKNPSHPSTPGTPNE